MNTREPAYPIIFGMLKRIILVFLITGNIFPFLAMAQQSSAIPDSGKKVRTTLYKAIAIEGAYYLGAMFVLQNTWYKDRKTVPFHFYNDNKGYLQVDKFGHAFGAYVESYIGYKSLLCSGVTKSKALIYGGTLGFVLQMPIEIMDGIHEGWGFSWGDMTANAIGSGLVIGQELLFCKQIVKYKFSYWESSYSKQANGYLGTTTMNRLLKDYNGHAYWLSMPVGLILCKKHLPAWLNIAAGYGANGMYGEYENISSFNGIEIPSTMRYRQYLLSLDIDWTNIKTRSKFLRIIFQGMTFIKLPFPALEYNSKGKFRGYWLYY